jgi:hypothetical protein
MFVSQLSATKLQDIARKAPRSERSRAQLTKEMASLAKAMEVP